MRAPAVLAPAAPALHARLRAATAELHARLHLHPGLQAIQDGSITLSAYQDVLRRLLGFYLPFEAACELPAERSAWLAADLHALGAASTVVPYCASLPPLETAAARLGAAYMAEGSLLGGRDLARRLDPLLGHGVLPGRRFFTGRDAATGPHWQKFLARVAATTTGQDAVVAASCASFGAFETWMENWRGP